MRGQIDFNHCTLYMDGNYCKTVFHEDQKFCTGTTGIDREDQLQSARNMGYPETSEGLEEMLAHHEILHQLVMQHMGFPYSTVHRLISYFGQNVPPELLPICEAEEHIVGAFQTWAQSGKVSKQLNQIVDPIYLLNKFKRVVCLQ